MKKFLDYVLAGVLFAIPCVSVMTSCSEDDDVKEQTANERKKTEVNDANAGEFCVTNISYPGTEDGLGLSALKGDTLKIIFTPNAKHKTLVFERKYDGLEQINDSLYRIKEDKAGTHEYKLIITHQEETDTTIVTVSAEATLKVNLPEAYVIIPYIIGMTNHLHELVMPEVTYTDANGKKHSFAVRDEDLTKQTNDDITTYFYTFNVRYYKTGITSSVSVSYIPRPDIQLSQERYYLYHSLRTGRADVHIPNLVYVDLSTSFSINIAIGGEDGVAKDEVPAMLEELRKTPDVLRLDIFKDNGIKEVK